MQPGRDLGVTETLRTLFDGSAELLLALVTQLGDVWFLFVLAGAVYVSFAGSSSEPRRRRGAFVLALPIVYIVLVGAMKGLFTLPRPPRAAVAPAIPWLPELLRPVFRNTATATGYGFPSGHAIGTTMVWGGVGAVLGRRPRRLRVAGVVAVVALVSFSRLALGVHYLVDVFAGAAIGAAVLGVLYWLSARGTRPGRVFAVAVGLALVGVAVRGSFDSVVALGGAAGAWLSWHRVVDRTTTLRFSRRSVGASAAVFLVTVLAFGALYLSGVPLPVAFVASVLAAALVVAVPDLGDRAARRLDAS
jgi:membrane-associated phospholipid phosphatase